MTIKQQTTFTPGPWKIANHGTAELVYLNDHLTRYHLPNGWFMDRETHLRLNYGKRYTVWEPGASESGCAALRGWGNTQRAALENAHIDPDTGYLKETK